LTRTRLDHKTGEIIMPTQFCAHRPVVMGTRWMITADHPLAAQTGAAILEAGGNAVDAAIGANLVMAVVRPHMCGLGGDLFALIYMAAESKFEALNASGRAPSAANLDVFRAKGYTVMPETGLLTATVPGAMAGWQAALEKYGSMSLDRLLPKAIDYAQNGFPVYAELRGAIGDRLAFLKQSPAAAETFFPEGQLPEVGQRLIQPRLAESLKILADHGPDAFYRGPLGEALIALCESDGGLIGPQDLTDHTVTWHAPLKTFHNVPVDQMLHKEYAKKQIERIHLEEAARAVVPTDFADKGNDTIFLSVVDGDGNAVALIQSLFEAFGSCVMVPETGMILHNRGRGFSLDPNHVNRLEPRKRPYHTLHPAMILKEGRPYMVLGTPGADGQTQTIIQLITSMLEFEADVQQAVEAPRWRGNPDGTLQLEGRFPTETIAGLKARGHALELLADWDPVMGSSQVILIDTNDGVLKAGADPRRQAYAIGC
jgi:gamma-glutamyltranspeptidase/glutathione hydrolase